MLPLGMLSGFAGSKAAPAAAGAAAGTGGGSFTSFGGTPSGVEANPSFTSFGSPTDPTAAPSFTGTTAADAQAEFDAGASRVEGMGNDLQKNLDKNTKEADEKKKPGFWSKFGMGGGAGLSAPKYFDPSGSGGQFAPEISELRTKISPHGI